MPLSIFCSNTSLESHRRLYERLKALDGPQAKHVFLVPDRFTLGVERDIVEKVFPDGYSRVDVASFTRFAVKHVGKQIKKCLSKEGTVVLLEKILEEKSEELKYFKKVKGYNFAKELFAAMASLRSAALTPDEIEDACKEKSGKLFDKLSDIAVIMREYESFLAKNYSDTITRIDALINCVRKGTFADVNFYVLGFNMYSAQQLSLLKALAENSLSLNIATVKSYRFYDPSRELNSLVEYCKENSVEVNTEESFAVIDSCFAKVREGIFGGHTEKCPTDRIRVFSAPTPFEEISAVGREIAYLTRKENYRYRDIAAVVNDASYLPYVRAAFERFDIPCFIDEGYQVTEGIAARYLIYLMEAADEFVPEKMFRFILHPFCDLTREEIKVFKNYCLKYNIRYSRFNEPFSLGKCEEAENIRKKIISRFVLPAKGTVKEYCEKLLSLLDEYKERTEKFAESEDMRLASSGHTEKLVTLLTETAELIPERVVTVGEMCGLVKAAAADLKTVLRPDTYDSVFVGNTEESRFSDVKILFVIGACDGAFPKKSGDGLIFTMSDNEIMKRNGLEVFPTPADRNAFEEYVVYDLLSKVRDRMYASCFEADLGGNVQNAGDAFKEIAYITDSSLKSPDEYRSFSAEEKFLYFLSTDKNAYKEYVGGNVPEQYRKATEKYLIEKGLLIKPATDESKPDFEKCFKKDGDNFTTSVSQLETYFTCPFRHFMKYGLKAEEPDAYSLKPSALGTAIHNVLESFFKNNLDKIYTDADLSSEAEKAIADEFSKPDYEGFYADPLSAYLMNGTRKECKAVINGLRENMRHSDFRPEGFEVGFGYRNNDNEILIVAKDKIFKLRGKIDRVDGNGRDVVIIDYKTGTVKPKLGSIYCGQKVQLYVYLGYYLKKGRRPAGVFYLPIKSGARKGGTDYTYTGQLIEDGEVYRALDGRSRGAVGKYDSPTLDISAYVSEDGNITFGRQKNVLKEEEFFDIYRYVDKLLEQGITEILDGYAEKKPIEGACKFCPYASMCGKVPERKQISVDAKDFGPSIREEGEESNGEQ